jgi:hypothetical protein
MGLAASACLDVVNHLLNELIARLARVEAGGRIEGDHIVVRDARFSDIGRATITDENALQPAARTKRIAVALLVATVNQPQACAVDPTQRLVGGEGILRP